MNQYCLALDLGKMVDYTVPCVIRTVYREYEGGKGDPLGRIGSGRIQMFQMVHIERLSMDHGYHDAATYVAELMGRQPLAGNCDLVIDMGNAGTAVLEIMQKKGLSPVGITTTSGHSMGSNDLGLTVPKMELISTVMMLFNMERVKIASAANKIAKDGRPYSEHIQALLHELDRFQFKASAKKPNHISYGNDSDNTHDDMVMAMAMGLWWQYRMGDFLAHTQEEEQYNPLDEINSR